MKYQLLFCAICLAIIFNSHVFAHHSLDPHFDRKSNISVTGVVTELKLVNPHGYIYLDVEQDGELVNWRCELTSGSALKRRGWSTESIKIGDKVVVDAYPAHREANVCFLISITLPTGQKVSRNNAIDEASVVVDQDITQRLKVLENGQPNLQGPWVTRSFGRAGNFGIKPTFSPTPAGETAMQGYEMAFDDPVLECHYMNLVAGWNHDAHVNDIIQSDDVITMQYGFMDVVRKIYLNISQHPDNLIPSSTGHSIGRWEGNTLVVHTTGFEEGILDHFSGLKHSSQMEITERFRFDSETKMLVRDYTMVDPLYLIGETVGQDMMALSAIPYTKFGCVELSGINNLRPTDERYKKLVESGVVPVSNDGATIIPKGTPISSSEPTQAEETKENTPEDADASSDKETPWWQFWD